MRSWLIFLAFLGPTLAAQTASPCARAESRQFDFWVGEWKVQNPDGKEAGTNSITKIANGCALLEQWSGQGGMVGKSLNAYDAARKRWHQTWVDNSGSVLYLDGEFRDGKMMLSGKTGETIERITWTQLENGDVRQLWEQSSDEGKTWKVAFDGRYVRTK